MVRVTPRLLQRVAASSSASPFTPRSPARYALGLSYASKSSPPFVPPFSAPKPYGFAPTDTRIGAWVRDQMRIRAGRGEMSAGEGGGWDEEALREEVSRWGAGEDFFCVLEGRDTKNPANSVVHLALSDGVGGWGDTVDPSLFSQGLMYHYAQSCMAPGGTTVPPWEHLEAAYEGVQADELVTAGGATACGVSLGGDGVLRGFNFGDSGLSVLRDGKTIFATKAQTHYFNCPRQLSKFPPEMQTQGLIRDIPSEKTTDRFTLPLLPGDCVVIYTDGYSDNVPSQHLPLLAQRIAALLAHPTNAHLTVLEREAEQARLLADVLLGYGRMGMQRTGEEDGGKGWKTPFEVEARKEGYEFNGGKVDDITVITAVVGAAEAEGVAEPKARL